MKWFNYFWFSLGFVFFTVVTQAQAPQAPDEDPEFVRARKLFWSGEYKDAEVLFKKYLITHPDDAPSRDFLKMIDQSRRYSPEQIAATQKFLSELKVGSLQMKDMEWRDACAQFENLANPKRSSVQPARYLNLINLLPSRFSRKITLNLKDVTMMEILEKAAAQAELRLVVDTWAVIFDLPEVRR